MLRVPGQVGVANAITEKRADIRRGVQQRFSARRAWRRWRGGSKCPEQDRMPRRDAAPDNGKRPGAKACTRS